MLAGDQQVRCSTPKFVSRPASGFARPISRLRQPQPWKAPIPQQLSLRGLCKPVSLVARPTATAPSAVTLARSASARLRRRVDDAAAAATLSPADDDLAEGSRISVPAAHRQNSAAVAPLSPTKKQAPSHAETDGNLEGSATPASPASPRSAELALLCQGLSLYSSFECRGGVWAASKQLRAKVFEYIASMGYDRPAPSGSCHASSSSSQQQSGAWSAGDSATMDIPSEDPLRWLAEQEYVVGTVLLTCVNHSQGQGGGGGGGPTVGLGGAIPPSVHPMRYAASYVLSTFPQWGSSSAFADTWESQVRLITQVACPDRQRTFNVSSPSHGGTLTFSSAVECGNLSKVEAMPFGDTTVFQLWIEADPTADSRMWFRFTVKGYREGVPLCLRMMNLAAHDRLYQNGMRPSWVALPLMRSWRLVDNVKFAVSAAGEGQLSFFVTPSKSDLELHFAFCVPYGYNDLLCHILRWHRMVRTTTNGIRFEERVLCRTWDQRKIHLLIITNQKELAATGNHVPPTGLHRHESGNSPYATFHQGKRVVLISGRVHPGEVTASHAVHGMIFYLLSSDPVAEKLREHFMFFIVPMLNPDGVARGHTRLDQKGNNLNSMYREPVASAPPAVAALKNVVQHLHSHFAERFFLFLDFHSHVSREKAFVFGNHLHTTAQVWNLVFPRLIELHSEAFAYSTCRFGLAEMQAKEGSARVVFGDQLIHSYTVELTPFTSGELDTGDDPPCALSGSADIGRACLKALADYCGITHSKELRVVGYEHLYREARRESRTNFVGAKVVKVPTTPPESPLCATPSVRSRTPIRPASARTR